MEHAQAVGFKQGIPVQPYSVHREVLIKCSAVVLGIGVVKADVIMGGTEDMSHHGSNHICKTIPMHILHTSHNSTICLVLVLYPPTHQAAHPHT